MFFFQINQIRMTLEKKRKASAAEHQIQRVKEILSESASAWNDLQIDRLALFSFDIFEDDPAYSIEEAKKLFGNIPIEKINADQKLIVSRILIRFHQIKHPFDLQVGF